MLKRSSMVDDATTEVTSILPEGPSGSPQPAKEKNPAAVALGRLGGKKGGVARAALLTADERSKIAQKAAQARWATRRKEETRANKTSV